MRRKIIFSIVILFATKIVYGGIEWVVEDGARTKGLVYAMAAKDLVFSVWNSDLLSQISPEFRVAQFKVTTMIYTLDGNQCYYNTNDYRVRLKTGGHNNKDSVERFTLVGYETMYKECKDGLYKGAIAIVTVIYDENDGKQKYHKEEFFALQSQLGGSYPRLATWQLECPHYSVGNCENCKLIFGVNQNICESVESALGWR